MLDIIIRFFRLFRVVFTGRVTFGRTTPLMSSCLCVVCFRLSSRCTFWFWVWMCSAIHSDSSAACLKESRPSFTSPTRSNLTHDDKARKENYNILNMIVLMRKCEKRLKRECVFLRGPYRARRSLWKGWRSAWKLWLEGLWVRHLYHPLSLSL